ncbi:MAG: hypothetical protein ACT4P3_22010 [Betaproteobacteria bacterium]
MKAKRTKARAKNSKPRQQPQLPDELREEEEEQAAALPRGRVLERPDGFYWEADGELHGPFATIAEAEADLLSGGAPDVGDPDALPEAESELGINEWIDPDTGGPAEDSVPRLEDH